MCVMKHAVCYLPVLRNFMTKCPTALVVGGGGQKNVRTEVEGRIIVYVNPNTEKASRLSQQGTFRYFDKRWDFFESH